MIQGKVNANLEAIISLQLRGQSGQTATVAALQLLFLETEEFTLGDGSDAVLNVHIGTVVWDGQERDVFVLAAEGGALVGMSLLDGYDLRIQVRDGGNMTIEALP